MTRVTVLGLGEAGRIYASGLAAAGAEVRAFDPYVRADLARVSQYAAIEDAVAGSAAVISLVGASASRAVAAAAVPAMRDGVFADFNTATPTVKTEIARIASEQRLLMADVAVLAPVPRAGVATQLLISGDGAAVFASVMAPFGPLVTTIDAPAGAAARMKLLRSVFMKGLATLIIEGLAGAETVGADAWLRGQIGAELGADGAALVERLVDGTYQHATRRLHEMHDALEGLESTGSPSDMTRATVAWFERIVRDGATES